MCRAAVVLERAGRGGANHTPPDPHLQTGRPGKTRVVWSASRRGDRWVDAKGSCGESELGEMGHLLPGWAHSFPSSSAAPPVSFRRGVEPIVSSRVPPRSSSLSTLALLRTSAPDRGRAISNTRSRGLPLPSYPGSSRGIHTHTLSICRLDVRSPGRRDGPGVRGGDQGKGGAWSSGGRHAIGTAAPIAPRGAARSPAGAPSSTLTPGTSFVLPSRPRPRTLHHRPGLRSGPNTVVLWAAPTTVSAVSRLE